MVFSSIPFVLIFIPIFFGCYYLSSQKNLILLIGSMIFYLVGTIHHPEHFILFLCCILLDYLAARWIEVFPNKKKIFFSIAVGFHLINLFLFKYSGFVFGEIIKYIPETSFSIKIVLPIGISFYTFQGISYLADVYKGKIRAEKKFIRYAVYIAMFEQLIAGPIVTYSDVKNELRHRTINASILKNGISIFIFGLGMKVLLANPLSKLWTQATLIGYESITPQFAWMAIVAYSFHIYFDFFGYSLMAIGLGKMLGFQLPKNFDHPYLSVTMTEFWRRWHMTLGYWFREYVYIPLGGNRSGRVATIRNLFIVWILTGVWHGAGYNFLLWGFTLFMILVIEKYGIGSFLNRHRKIGHLYMIFLIPLTWTIFAIDDIRQLGIYFTRLFPFLGTQEGSVFRYDYIKYFKIYYPFLFAGILFSTKLPYRFLKKIKQRQILIDIFICIIFMISLYCMYKGFDDPFLYFRF